MERFASKALDLVTRVLKSFRHSEFKGKRTSETPSQYARGNDCDEDRTAPDKEVGKRTMGVERLWKRPPSRPCWPKKKTRSSANIILWDEAELATICTHRVIIA